MAAYLFRTCFLGLMLFTFSAVSGCGRDSDPSTVGGDELQQYVEEHPELEEEEQRMEEMEENEMAEDLQGF